MSITYTCGRRWAAGLALAFAAATTAHAGEPMNVLQKQAAAQAMLAAYQQRQVTGADAQNTPPGVDSAEVPEDLHNYMHAVKGKDGKVRVVESDGPVLKATAQEAQNDR